MLQIDVIESLDTLCGKMTWETYRNLGLLTTKKDSVFSRLIDENHFKLAFNEETPCIVELVNDENLSANTLYVSKYIKEQFYSNKRQIDIDEPPFHRPIVSVGN